MYYTCILKSRLGADNTQMTDDDIIICYEGKEIVE